MLFIKIFCKNCFHIADNENPLQLCWSPLTGGKIMIDFPMPDCPAPLPKKIHIVCHFEEGPVILPGRLRNLIIYTNEKDKISPFGSRWQENKTVDIETVSNAGFPGPSTKKHHHCHFKMRPWTQGFEKNESDPEINSGWQIKQIFTNYHLKESNFSQIQRL